MYRLGLVLCSVLVAAAAQSTEVSQCISNAGSLPINTYIDGCVSPPCMLYKGSNAIINIIFRLPYTVPQMTTLATAYLIVGPISVPVPYDLRDDAVTCNFLINSYCPVVADEVVQYRLLMSIDDNFPSGTSVTIEFRVVDHNRVPMVCIRVPVRVEDPPALLAMNSNSTVV